MSGGVVVERDELLVGVGATEQEVPDGLAFHLSVKLDECITDPANDGVAVLANLSGFEEPRVGQDERPFAEQYVEGFKVGVSQGYVAAVVHRHGAAHVTDRRS